MAPTASSSSAKGGSSPLHHVRRLISLAVFAAAAYLIFGSNEVKFDPFRLHPLFMTMFATGTLPEVLSTVAALKNRKKGSSKSSLINHHQFAAFLLQVSGAIGFGSIIYIHHVNNRPHGYTPHAKVGFVCGIALMAEVVVGAMLRYVISAKSGIRQTLLTIHGLLSLTITITTLMAFSGGMLGTNFAKKMIPSVVMRGAISLLPLILFFLAFAA